MLRRVERHGAGSVQSTEPRRIAYERARVAAEIAEQVLAPAGPGFATSAYHVAAGLFVESIGWALRAWQAMQQRAEPAQLVFEGPPGAQELARLFTSYEGVLLRAASGPDDLERLRAHALQRDFESTARPVADAEQAAHRLSRVARHLLRLLSAAQGGERRGLERAELAVAALVLLAAVSLGWGPLRDQHERRTDLAAGKPWRASSSYQAVCQSPQRRCSASKSYFFHTAEEASPWLELDLTQKQEFSRVNVFNRRDCCGERAAPLLIEVSSDRATWREVSRRDQGFDAWRASFAPVSARWVRLRVARHSMLHLSDVRVLR